VFSFVCYHKHMTKYALNSGGIKNQPELKRQFHQELVYSELEIYGDTSLPIRALKEGEFIVYEQ